MVAVKGISSTDEEEPGVERDHVPYPYPYPNQGTETGGIPELNVRLPSLTRGWLGYGYGYGLERTAPTQRVSSEVTRCLIRPPLRPPTV